MTTSYIHPSRAITWGTLILGAIMLTTGCATPEEQITKVMERTLVECKGQKGDFATIELFSGDKIEVLREVCDMPMTDLKVEDKVTGTAKTGPYDWKISTHPDSGIWVIADISWQDMLDVKRIMDQSKPDPNTLVHAEKKFAEIQKLVPKSAWVRQSRMENALRLRKATRAKENKDNGTELVGLGKVAQAVYTDTLAFAKETNNPELAAKARLGVIEYHQKYERFLANTLEGSGKQDEWVQSAIELAVKEKNKEDEEKYRKELKERQETRQKREVEFKARKEKVHMLMCEELKGLSSDGVKNEDLASSINNLKSNTVCEPPKVEEDPKKGK